MCVRICNEAASHVTSISHLWQRPTLQVCFAHAQATINYRNRFVCRPHCNHMLFKIECCVHNYQLNSFCSCCYTLHRICHLLHNDVRLRGGSQLRTHDESFRVLFRHHRTNDDRKRRYFENENINISSTKN